MSTGTQLSPLDYVRQFSTDTGSAFQALRKAVLGSGPLDPHTCELIVLGALVTSGGEASFKVHARRLLKEAGRLRRKLEAAEEAWLEASEALESATAT